MIIDYLEHGGADPSGFWPHICETCNYFTRGGCTLDCERYAGLPLDEYLALRTKEEKG